ncbi:ataxin-3 homolog isoform X3 [Rhododendron vialii]|uniref:ataxin-3 homolog isoform X3 n=1 Tax=Rhododendron vialii TaxID=182163 RepID=UPI00265E9BF7|nr:ataxin-3 homolog isoform X3 [Rhododendron vialii]
MEGPSNGGMLYHEVQESKLCAVHCVNTVLQGPFFSEFDLAALASDLDCKERQMMLEGGSGAGLVPEESHNVSLDGDFSIQDHWFCIRKVNGEWYNFDSLYAAPEHLSKFYLSAYLDTLKGFGWSIFLVRGNFPKECLIASSDASNGYGQWLLPEDAERITKSCNSGQRPTHGTRQNREISDPSSQFGEAEMLLEAEDEDLKAAIAASLMDSSPAPAPAPAPAPEAASAEVGTSENENNTTSEENVSEKKPL